MKTNRLKPKLQYKPQKLLLKIILLHFITVLE